jgi:hypothetical protein
MRPPEEVFCMQCGPGTQLQPDRSARLLRCPRCGVIRRLPGLPLVVVTGASGTGKTTIAEPLRRRLPDCEVFDTDVILRVAALGWDTWRNTWLQLAHAIALNGRASVLCGSLLPAQLEGLPARRLAERLRARPDWRGSSHEANIVEHQCFAAWLRQQIRPTFDTSALSVDAVAGRVAGWVRQLLAGTAPGSAARAAAPSG